MTSFLYVSRNGIVAKENVKKKKRKGGIMIEHKKR